MQLLLSIVHFLIYEKNSHKNNLAKRKKDITSLNKKKLLHGLAREKETAWFGKGAG
jgi:hypothetical protein